MQLLLDKTVALVAATRALVQEESLPENLKDVHAIDCLQCIVDVLSSKKSKFLLHIYLNHREYELIEQYLEEV